MKRVRIFGAALALLAGIGLSGAGPALAVQAGQFCASADANKITTAANGDTVQCTFNANSNRFQYVKIAAGQVTTTTAPVTTTTSTTVASVTTTTVASAATSTSTTVVTTTTTLPSTRTAADAAVPLSVTPTFTG